MVSANDFSKKQIVFVRSNSGEKIAVKNDNLIIKNNDDEIILQISFYRIFLVYIIGSCSITTPLLQRANKFGFYIALMTTGFRLYSIIGASRDGNTLLKRKQYKYNEIDIGRRIIENKIHNQKTVLKAARNKNDMLKEAIVLLDNYENKVKNLDNIHEIMAYEGLASKLYFKNHFNNICWNGRQPRLKKDYINSLLDIGYTVLFSFMEAIVSCFGFDTYCGVFHTQFYMRKSLICDLVEPFRPMIDIAVKKAINLGQVKE